jgi:hypothetical protein
MPILAADLYAAPGSRDAWRRVHILAVLTRVVDDQGLSDR